MLLHGKIPTCHIAAHLLHVLRMALCRGPRWSRLGRLRLRLLLVGGSDLVRYLNSPGAPHGAAVHKRLPVPVILHARVDSQLTATTATVRDLRNGRGMILRVRRRKSVPRGAAHHPARLIHQVHLLLFILIIVIEMGQLGLILIGGGMMKGWLQRGKALVYRHLLTHGVHWIFRVTAISKAFEAFTENIPILTKKTHHSWIRHLLPTHGSFLQLQLRSLSVLHFTEVFVLKACNP